MNVRFSNPPVRGSNGDRVPVHLKTSGHDFAVKVLEPNLSTRHRFAQSISGSRRTASAIGFFILSHWFVRPARTASYDACS
jgi:hypothetical protein